MEQRDAKIIQTVTAALGLPGDKINDGTSAETVPAWDSVTHLNLVLALEEAFGTSFTPEETLGMTSVGAIRRLLESRKA
ncbi:MAG TPA: acyl carrier protein [Verrucomicrobiales bacterium]|nr:acyl carrier protein [Verrucomicrobiales bacterium]